MKAPKPFTRTRILIVFSFLIICLTIIAARVIYVDARYSDRLIERRDRQSRRIIALPARRGSVMDAGGNKLAMDVPCQSVYAVPKVIDKKLAVARQLAQILGLDAGQMQERFEKDSSFVWVKRKITDVEADRVKALKLPGLGFIEETKRIYPNDTLAASIVGFRSEDYGIEGVEKSYENWLRGQDGKIILEKDAIGRNVPQSETERVDSRNGNDIYLTIDKNIQFNAEKELKATVAQFNSPGGAIIVMDPSTGRILALASYPDFDPNRHTEFPQANFRNQAVSYVYEPGSIMKPVIAAAALDSGKMTPTSPTFFCPGHLTVGNHSIGEAHGSGYGTIDLSTIIAKSSNVGMAQVGMFIGKDVIKKYVKLFGFGQKMKLGLNGEEFGLLPRDDWYDRSITVATVSFGQGISVTPIQMATAYATIANNGVMMKPTILDRVVSSEGEVLYKFAPQAVRRVVSEKAAADVRLMLQKVVTEGTGDNARIPRYNVGGKTGTAQVATGGSYANRKYIASFVGFAPVENPRVLVLVMIEDPKPVFYGGLVAAPAFQRVMLQALLYLKVPPSDMAPPAAATAAGGTVHND